MRRKNMWMAVKRGIVVAIGLLIQILLTLFIYLKFGEFISIIQVVYGLLSITDYAFSINWNTSIYHT